jgi:glycosyltransferase involved in cell wall biosynthesis
MPHPAEALYIARRLASEYSPEFVIANTAESRDFAVAFEKAGVPAIALIHEFSASVRPEGCLHELFITASRVVFSAEIVAQSHLADYDYLAGRPFDILPQGQFAQPGLKAAQDESDARLDRLADDGDCLVIGVGTITPRKGVDAFLATAAAARRLAPNVRFKFAWAGKCFDFDRSYKDLLDEQIVRTGLSDHFVFLGELANVEPVYKRGDVYLLASRLDPLPNTAIDAAFNGLPVVCFDGASGIAELWKQDPVLNDLVVPYLDTEAAARAIVDLADNKTRRTATSETIKRFAASRFDMDDYVRKIVALGQESAAAIRRMEPDRKAILEANLFNASLYEGRSLTGAGAPHALHKYLNSCRIATPCNRPFADLLVRRPVEGFHPLIYAASKADFDATSYENPLAHYIRHDLPSGPWTHEVIRPDPTPASAQNARIAVHGHFHYPELFEEFAGLVERNALRPDLFLTATSDEAATILKRALKGINCAATVTVVPNRGRDIGAFLSAYPYSLFEAYDVVGHFHGKRSPHIDPAIGDRWRHFIYDHLLGFKTPMMSQIVSRLMADKGLGLVFPEDPHLNGWNHNASIADDLARRAGIALPLPVHFEFAHGTMFWAKPLALKALFDMKLTWPDYPAEPLPIDGTILHALERLVTHSAEHAGFRYATVYTGERWR